MIERPRIIDVVRKPRKCPVCGERVWISSTANIHKSRSFFDEIGGILVNTG